MMRVLAPLFLGYIILAIVTQPLAAQENPVPKAQVFYQQAMQAYQQQDFATCVQHMKEVIRLRPNHPSLLYVLAKAFLLNNQQDEALHWLEHVAAMGTVFTITADDSFRTVSDTARLRRICSTIETNALPIANSTRAFTLTEKDFIPEGIACDMRTKAFFVGSVYKRKIVRVVGGKEEEFISQLDGLWSVFGICIDTTRNALWVCTAAVPQTAGVDTSEIGRSELLCFDLSTRKKLYSYTVSGAHIFGDLALSPQGDVYVSDTKTNAVYILPAGGSQLQEYIAPGVFSSPQGLVCTPDGGTLFVADYSRGIARISIAQRTVAFLPYPDNATLLGIDGLCLYGDRLVAVQNGMKPQRVIALTLHTDLDSITQVQVLEANNDSFDEPTLGVVVGDMLYYVANSQWSAFGKDGTLADVGHLAQPLLLALPLEITKR